MTVWIKFVKNGINAEHAQSLIGTEIDAIQMKSSMRFTTPLENSMGHISVPTIFSCPSLVVTIIAVLDLTVSVM